MRDLNTNEIERIGGGREAQGANRADRPDRTRSEAMRENHQGRDWSMDDLNNVSLGLTAIGAVTPGVPGRVLTGLGAAGAAVAGWSRKDK
ncbi:hypothetical protein NMS06_003184 [Vibrio cholerae]|nr:hypothetical protein [Vibrio cholerae]EJL6441840.1 hypothetical protein [Vibrio cholerae]